MPDSITQWLEQHGLGQYAEAFEEGAIDWDILSELDHEVLKELGVQSPGHRLRILKAIQTLGDSKSTEVSFPPNDATPNIALAASSEAERRQLTVMFCDLVGSTELTQHLDPEELGMINRAFQDSCTRAIQKFDGHVARYMGDGLLAYFGYPQAYEDAAERAIRAGLSVVAGIKDINGDAARDVAKNLAVRVGIATGLVVVGDLVGDGAARENTVVGETPNLAARLQSLAVPDTVIVAPKTRQLAGDLFEYQDIGEHSLKGIDKPVRVCVVRGEAEVESRFDAMHTSNLTPLVGREQEIALLLDRWHEAKEGEGQVVLLSGEPGIGKSRITLALRKHIAAGDDPIRLRYQCSPYHTSSALRPIIDQLEWAAHIEIDDQPESRLDKLESLLAQSTKDVTSIAPLMASLLSIPVAGRYAPIMLAPEQQKEKTLETLVALLKGLCERKPVLFIFEDAHWSDPTSLELLGAIIEEIQGNRVLVLITFRPEINPPWTGYTHITALTLNRFSRGRAAALINEVTSGRPLPEEVRDQIIDKTDGIPLFVEELTKTVLESGLVEVRDDHYAMARPLTPLAIPSTIQDSLMARLDRLGEARETAQIAAVIGREFSFDLLAKVSTLPDVELDSALAQLTDAALVFPKGTSPHARYVFKHAMVQEAAYESLLKSKRRLLHSRVAEVMEGESVEDEPELLAHHFGEAGRYESATIYWLKAGQRALERSANVEAVTHLRKGLDLLPRLPENANVNLQELEMQLALGPALMAIKGYSAPEIESVYARARELCRQVGRQYQLFAATWGLWLYYQQSGRLKQARELTEELLSVAQQQDDSAILLQAHHAAWATFHRLGELPACRHHAEKGIRLYDVEQHGSHAYLYGGHDPGVCAQTHVGIVLWCLGYPDQGLERAVEALNLSERLSHPFSRVDALFGAARIYLYRQEFQQAQALADEMISLSSQHGFALMNALGTIMRGSALTGEERAFDVIDEMRRGLDTTLETGAQAHVPYMMSLLIDTYRQLERVAEGLDTAVDALQLIEKTGEQNWESEILRLKGELLLVEPMTDQSAAEHCFNQALGIACTQNARSLELRTAMSLARLWRIQGKHEEAHDLLNPIYDWFTEGFDTSDLKNVKVLLEELK